MTTWRELVRDAAKYPFRGRGPYVIGTTVVIAWVLGLVPLSNVLLYLGAVGLSVVFAAYWIDFAFDVTATTAEGEDLPPRWPDLREYESVLFSSARTLILVIACFGIPTFVLLGTDGADSAMVVLILAGMVYFPTAFTEAAIGGSSIALLPHIVVPAITRAGRRAAIASVAFLAAVLAIVIAWWFTRRVPLIGPPIGTLIASTVAMSAARMFGLVRRTMSAAPRTKESS